MHHRINVYTLHLFATVAQEGSIVRAAAREHIAASALSRRLADLEHAFGAPLMVRSPRGVELTDAGRLVLARGERIDRELQELARDVQSHGGRVAGTVRVWANMSAVIGFLPERLRSLLARYPELRISLHEEDTADVVRACIDDRADVGIGVRTEVPQGMEQWPFASDPLLVTLPRAGPAAHAGLCRGDAAPVDWRAQRRCAGPLCARTGIGRRATAAGGCDGGQL